MNARILLRLSGLAALLGGAMRIASSFPLPFNAVEQEAWWDATDALLTLGLIGVYLVRAEKLGFLGLSAFAVGMAALSFIGGPDADPFGFSTYQQGAAVLAIAMVGLSLAWLRARERPISAPLLWFASVIAVGVMNLAPAPLPDFGFRLAGGLFGGGFVCAGWSLFNRKS